MQLDDSAQPIGSTVVEELPVSAAGRRFPLPKGSLYLGPLAGECIEPDVDQHVDTVLNKKTDEFVDRTLLVSDRHECWSVWFRHGPRWYASITSAAPLLDRAAPCEEGWDALGCHASAVRTLEGSRHLEGEMGKQTIRTVGFALLALAAMVVMATQGPSREDPDVARDALIEATATDLSIDVGLLARQALVDYGMNDALADSAPQQQVTNGWVARDLLSAIALAQHAQIELSSDTQLLLAQIAASDPEQDGRPAWLLFLVVAGMTLFALTGSEIERVAESLSADPEVEPTSSDLTQPE